ncbi:MAG: phenylalanine--tRNA ligase subunit beta [Candidatus Binatia bacterium]
MKFTLNWLKEFVPVEVSPERLAHLFTMAGLEVELVTPLREADGKEDWLFEVSVTPNRGDCLSVTGLAREVAAFSGQGLKSDEVKPRRKAASVLGGITVSIENSEACPRYSAAIVEDIRLAPAPEWMRYRLEICGIRSINNVVDITNYVMLETGQPLHAFDLDGLASGSVVIRPAGAPGKFVTLDEIERELAVEDLLICDGDRPVALAGIMGGIESEVKPGTRRLLLESAHFDPTTIRRTAKRMGLHSEASHRFERGVDPEGTVAALERAVSLLSELAGGSPMDGHLDRYPRPPKEPSIDLREERIEKLLGVRIERGEIEKLLTALGLKLRKHSKKGVFKVVPPTRRPDLNREADLIEELARLHGYEKIPSSLPLVRSSGGRIDLLLRRERQIRAFLAGEGFSEVINLPFTSERMNRLFVGLWEGGPSPVAVVNPLATESAEMRLSLLPGLLENLRTNLAQKGPSFFGFQLGKVFRSAPNDETQERQYLSGVLYGPRPRRGLRMPEESASGFLECKGLIEGILELLRVSDQVTFGRESNPVLHPGRAAALLRDREKLGYFGQSHPDLREATDLPPFLMFELDFEGLVQYAPRQITYRSLPRFPSVERDFAIVVDKGFSARQVVNWINDLGLVLIERVEVFDQYYGSPIPEGKKSLAYKISYRAGDRTLTDTEVSALHQDVVDRVGKTFDAQLRS